MGKKSSSSSNSPWKAAQPFILHGANTLNDAYNSNIGKIQGATDSITGLLPSLIDKYKAGDPGITAAQGYNTDVLGGKYLGANPYLDDVLARSNNDVVNQTQAALGLRGLTGGSDYAGLIADRVAKNTLATRYGDYNSERDRMANAAGQAPGLAMADYMAISPALSVANASSMPLHAASGYAGSLGGLLGGYQTQSQKPSTASSIMQGVGTVASLASVFSDARLKTDVTRVGQTDGGLTVYSYRYGGEGPFHMGVMAQEVRDQQPDALGPVVDGFMTVNYAEVR